MIDLIAVHLQSWNQSVLVKHTMLPQGSLWGMDCIAVGGQCSDCVGTCGRSLEEAGTVGEVAGA